MNTNERTGVRLADIKAKIHAGGLSRKGDIYTARWGFFYRHGGSSEKKVELVKEIFPNAEIVQHFEHYANFNGGAPLARSSHWRVDFKI